MNKNNNQNGGIFIIDPYDLMVFIFFMSISSLYTSNFKDFINNKNLNKYNEYKSQKNIINKKIIKNKNKNKNKFNFKNEILSLSNNKKYKGNMENIFKIYLNL